MTCRVPLDLALYSRKGRADYLRRRASSAEKQDGAREYLVKLAGQDPGNVDKALRLQSDLDATLNVVVSDNFLSKVSGTV